MRQGTDEPETVAEAASVLPPGDESADAVSCCASFRRKDAQHERIVIVMDFMAIIRTFLGLGAFWCF